jgi:hypothetical protein
VVCFSSWSSSGMRSSSVCLVVLSLFKKPIGFVVVRNGVICFITKTEILLKEGFRDLYSISPR